MGMKAMKSEVDTAPPTRMKRGVYRTSWGNRWFSQIRRDGKLHYLGTYQSEEEAQDAFDAAAEALSS